MKRKNSLLCLIEWFFTERSFELLDSSEAVYERILKITLDILIKKYQPELPKEDQLFYEKSLYFWALVEYNKLSKI
jgi:magnesium chelatase subunit I